MKTVAIVSLLFLLFAMDGYCTENAGTGAGASSITIDFRVPSNWKKVGKNSYALKNFGKTLEEWDKVLSEGHQPWRLEPKNAAGACLWDFGINDNSRDILDFTDHLTEIGANRSYVLKAGESSYYVFVRVADAIPIAYRLVVVTDESPRE
jgi:hypothetical protein